MVPDTNEPSISIEPVVEVTFAGFSISIPVLWEVIPTRAES
jgi:hypothetical protein